MFLRSWSRWQDSRSAFGAAVVAFVLASLLTTVLGASSAHACDAGEPISNSWEEKAPPEVFQVTALAVPCSDIVRGQGDESCIGEHCTACLGGNCFGGPIAAPLITVGFSPEAGACVHVFPEQTRPALTKPDAVFRPPRLLR